MENRQIKFRAWNPDDNKMEYPIVFAICSNGRLNPLIKCSDLDYSYKDYPLMQFTGLTDKTGKEIYEGDIIRLDDICCSVTFSNGSFQMIMDEQQGRSPIIQERACRFEIIGNIYENPELKL